MRHEISRPRTCAAAALVGCGLWLSGRAQASALAPPASPTTHQLAAMLLPLSALPAGWHRTTTGSGAHASGIGCLSHLLEPSGLRQLASVQASYAPAAKVPALTEKLATYADGPVAAFAKVRVELGRCRHFAGSVDHQAVTGTLRPMRLARLGTHSAAYVVALSVRSITLHEDVLIVDKAPVVLGLAEASTTPISRAQFLHLARFAAERVR
ncbi:MAG: hypothetical protein M0004_03150 [Actinomycetota bacterium]|nr:hypothetical protein [Actinomycetota bacterium]